jgi:hypothetical protein
MGVEVIRLEAFGAFIECPGSKYTGHLVTTEAQTGGEAHAAPSIGKNLIASGSTA